MSWDDYPDPHRDAIGQMVKQYHDQTTLAVEQGLGRMALAGRMRSTLHVWSWIDVGTDSAQICTAATFDPNEDVDPTVAYHPFGERP